jgi:O-antigen ligase
LNLSNYLILAAPFSSIVFVFTKSRILRICGFFTAFLSSISLIWIESRAGWLAVPIATLLVCFRRNIKAGFLLTVILVVAANFLGPVYKIRALTTFDVSSWSRIELYETALRIFKSYPVLGSGPGMYEKLVNSVEFRPINGYLGQVVHPHAHNTYLEILSEMGIVGLIGFSSIFIAFFSFLFKSKKIWDETVGEQSVLLIGISGSILATLIFALASTIITVGMQDAPVFWFLFGIASGLLPPFFIDKRSV